MVWGLSASQDRLPRLQIPFSPDPEFVGREPVLRELHQKVSLSNIHSRHALYGLGGVGYASLFLIINTCHAYHIA